MKVKKISITIWCLAVLSLAPLLPVTRAAAIAVAESILGRALNFARPWNEIMILCGLLGFLVLAILGFAYNVFDFHDFVPADLQSDNFRHFGVKSGVKILDDKRFALAFVLVFAALVALRCYWISQKKSYHMDELCSMNYANVNVHGFWPVKDIVPWETNRLYTGKELNDLGFWDDPSLIDVFSDLAILHINNGGDLPNCNFYQTLLRLWFAGGGICDFKTIVWRACILNLVIFAFSYYFMFVLLSRFTHSKASILACLFIAFCSPQMISATLYIRHYELQVCMAIVCAILFCDSFDAVFTSLRFESKRNLFLGALMIALFLLTGYFSLILMVFLGLALVSLCFVKRRYDSAGFLFWMFALSVVFALALYFRYGAGLLFGGITRSASKLSPSTIFTNLFQTFLYAIIIFTRENIFLILLFALCLILFVFHAVCFFKDKAKSVSFVCKLTLICCATLFYLATLYFAPWKILRYVTAAFPFFSLLFAFDVKKKATVTAQILACVCLIASVLPIWKYEMKTLPQESTPVALIEHVDDARIDEIELAKDESIPVVFFGEGRYVMVIPYLQDAQKEFFIDDMADLDTIKAEYGQVWFCMDVDECELFEKTKYNVVSHNDIGWHQREFLLD